VRVCVRATLIRSRNTYSLDAPTSRSLSDCDDQYSIGYTKLVTSVWRLVQRSSKRQSIGRLFLTVLNVTLSCQIVPGALVVMIYLDVQRQIPRHKLVFEVSWWITQQDARTGALLQYSATVGDVALFTLTSTLITWVCSVTSHSHVPSLFKDYSSAFAVLMWRRNLAVSRGSVCRATRLGNGPPNYWPRNIISPELAHGAATGASDDVVTNDGRNWRRPNWLDYVVVGRCRRVGGAWRLWRVMPLRLRHGQTDRQTDRQTSYESPNICL